MDANNQYQQINAPKVKLSEATERRIAASVMRLQNLDNYGYIANKFGIRIADESQVLAALWSAVRRDETYAIANFEDGEIAGLA